MKRVALWPGDEGACGFYRINAPVQACQEQGFPVEVRIDSPCGPGALAVTDRYTGEVIINTAYEPDYDVAVFQRPANNKALPIIKWLHDKGVEVVVEVDDNFRALQPSNQAYWAYRGNPNQNVQTIAECCRVADRVVVSTPELATVYGADYVIPNCIPGWYLDVGRTEREEWSHTLGWTGTIGVHRDDLKVVGVGVSEALKKSGWQFMVVGESAGVGHELHLEADPPETGWLSIDDYVKWVAELGVGIAPIADTAFNRSKSWLKALEYMALGVPAVCSDLPEYRRLGYGLLVKERSREWKGALLSLMNDEQARLDMVTEGREAARGYTYEANAHYFWEAWSGS